MTKATAAAAGWSQARYGDDADDLAGRVRAHDAGSSGFVLGGYRCPCNTTEQEITMADQGQENLRARLNDELSEAYRRFYAELSEATFQWGWWTKRGRRVLGPFDADQVGQIYRALLAVFFIAGVVLSVVGQVTRELGVGLVVGSLFAFGAWMSQAWAISREDESRLASKLLGELHERDLKLHAAQIKEIVHRLEKLDKAGGLERDA